MEKPRTVQPQRFHRCHDENEDWDEGDDKDHKNDEIEDDE